MRRDFADEMVENNANLKRKASDCGPKERGFLQKQQCSKIL